ncbi:hypothetical protein S7711_10768 [Stachybotrys chartarum IBT 7711]|uniref:Uncharacterized protein n=1 Tax=Stachybotrys chartarum (strain CBS 109288 / IBT 7711) TaxID=1280523 RepID=A0A084AU95_STACB|nr:hypothetical protein S7711_10768 [Stachybotrys chartarum IBT 7711]KFA74065.1 hypothetical protein S40288_11002 [Stachybotrys chartarum IBT 40288]
MSSSTQQSTNGVSSDAASEVTMMSESAASYSKPGSIAETSGNLKTSMRGRLQQLQNKFAPSSSTSAERKSNNIPEENPYKSWEARYYAVSSR